MKIAKLGLGPCHLCGKESPRFNQWLHPDGLRRFCSANCFDLALLKDQIPTAVEMADGLPWLRQRQRA